MQNKIFWMRCGDGGVGAAPNSRLTPSYSRKDALQFETMLSIRWWQVGLRLLTPCISHTPGVAAARPGLFWGRRFAATSTRKYLPCGGGSFFRTLATWCWRLFWIQGPSCRSRSPRSPERLQNSRLCKAPCRPITEQWCKVEEGLGREKK